MWKSLEWCLLVCKYIISLCVRAHKICFSFFFSANLTVRWPPCLPAEVAYLKTTKLQKILPPIISYIFPLLSKGVGACKYVIAGPNNKEYVDDLEARSDTQKNFLMSRGCSPNLPTWAMHHQPPKWDPHAKGRHWVKGTGGNSPSLWHLLAWSSPSLSQFHREVHRKEEKRWFSLPDN